MTPTSLWHGTFAFSEREKFSRLALFQGIKLVATDVKLAGFQSYIIEQWLAICI
jgi:hypothetical protein